ncbi:endolytic transglycosylase MltG [Puerhibacterium puerhi]|uniref:endolytic transglycosylase MltG n=1 Tax=Puerhibacterium puerhi TaxID=2692623 RepID=UPI00135AC372|nr:endolytic transglycosylase MltG [Puerhibacterium puerhi]
MTDLFEPPALQQPVPSRRSAARQRAAAKRRRRRRRRTALVVVACLLVVGAVGYVTWGNVSGLLSNPFSREAEDFPGPGDQAVEVEIPAGATGAEMGQVLKDAGVVASVEAFKQAFGENPQAAGIQPGVYQLLTEMKASDAVAALAKNEKLETRVTIPEGFTAEQVLERIASVTTISRADLDAAVADPTSIGLPAEADGTVEGWLSPATYTVQPDDTAQTLLSQMVARTVSELDELGVAAEDRHEVLTEASIVEREAPDDYRGQVARVIDNRLERGEPLGMDAIDAYGLRKPASEITRDEFNDPDLPYASRVHQGLPPTPIGNPGRASIEAVVHPPAGDWLWYVTVNLDTGETKFTDNYDEFQQLKQEYQEWQENQG